MPKQETGGIVTRHKPKPTTWVITVADVAVATVTFDRDGRRKKVARLKSLVDTAEIRLQSVEVPQ